MSAAVDYPPPSSVKSSYAPEPGSPIRLVLPRSNLSISLTLDPSAPPPTSTVAFLDEVNPETLSPEFKREGQDWFAVFNPKLKPALDVSLLNTFNHERYEACSNNRSDSYILLVSSAASAFLPMGNCWRPAATVSRRFTIRRLFKEFGKDTQINRRKKLTIIVVS